METSNISLAPVSDVLPRPAAAAVERLSAWDDYPIHQSSAVVGAVTPSLPGWAERFYFNVLLPSGEVAIMGGGVYPAGASGSATSAGWMATCSRTAPVAARSIRARASRGPEPGAARGLAWSKTAIGRDHHRYGSQIA